jgi:diguanylate cyclase (GGDEF)-like protein
LKADPALSGIPVVFLTGRTSTGDMVAGLRAGAHDYLKKPFEPAELLARISGAVRMKRLQDELRMRNDQLDALSRVDALTGIFNRRHLDEQLLEAGRISARNQQSLAIVMLDIDHFKHINDSHGHPAGDLVLQEFARRLRSTLRAGNIVGRWGGEEFLVIAPRTTADQAMMLGERIRLSIADQPIDLGSVRLSITVSVGCGVGLKPSAELVALADVALYRSKAEGRNRVTVS